MAHTHDLPAYDTRLTRDRHQCLLTSAAEAGRSPTLAIERPGQLIPMRVRVRGTAEIDKAHIIRDGSIVRAQRPGMQETDFQFGDTASGESGRSRYSYVRTEQAGGQAA